MTRFFDIIFSGAAIVFFLPIIVIVSLLLRLTGEGEIFYLQHRVGLKGKKFVLFKFATMKKNSPFIGPGNITVKNDPRVLPVGKYLRKAKINELPQLFNIFWGDMSIIGPRPLTEDTFFIYSKPQQLLISSVRPGLSGAGSVFFRNEENLLEKSNNPKAFYKNKIAPYKAKIEVWFVKNANVKLYFYLIVLTILVVFYPNFKNFILRLKDFPSAPKGLESF